MPWRLGLPMRTRYPYPQHRYPALLGYPDRPVATDPTVLSPTRQRIVSSLRAGARVLFDVTRGRALVYRFRQGVETLMEMTVRTLAWLVRHGHLVVAEREGRLVHYVSPSRG